MLNAYRMRGKVPLVGYKTEVNALTLQATFQRTIPT